MNNLTGTIKVICPTENISDNFSKRSLIVDIGGDTPINLEYHFDDCALLDEYKEGEQVKVEFNLDGRAWQKTPQDATKYFVTLKIAGIERLGEQPAAAPQQAAPTFEAPPMPALDTPTQDDMNF